MSILAWQSERRLRQPPCLHLVSTWTRDYYRKNEYIAGSRINIRVIGASRRFPRPAAWILARFSSRFGDRSAGFYLGSSVVGERSISKFARNFAGISSSPRNIRHLALQISFVSTRDRVSSSARSASVPGNFLGSLEFMSIT